MKNPLQGLLRKPDLYEMSAGEQRERRRRRERTLVRRAIEMVLCIALGFSTFVATSSAELPELPAVLAAFCALMLSLQAQYFFQNLNSEAKVTALQDDLDKLQKVIENQSDSTKQTVTLHERIGKIQNALRNDKQFERLCEYNELLFKVDVQKAQASPVLVEYIEWKERRIIASAMSQIEKLAGGTIEIDDIYRELIANSEFLLRLASKKVRAISFQDEAFWESPEGQNFLINHRQAISSGISVTRIFVLSVPPTASTLATIKEQLDTDIDVYIYNASAAELSQIEDFVIYDSSFVRLGMLPQLGPFESLRLSNPGLSKFAKLTNNQDEVQKYEYQFEAIRLRALPAQEWINRQEKQGALVPRPPADGGVPLQA